MPLVVSIFVTGNLSPVLAWRASRWRWLRGVVLGSLTSNLPNGLVAPVVDDVIVCFSTGTGCLLQLANLV